MNFPLLTSLKNKLYYCNCKTKNSKHRSPKNEFSKKFLRCIEKNFSVLWDWRSKILPIFVFDILRVFFEKNQTDCIFSSTGLRSKPMPLKFNISRILRLFAQYFELNSTKSQVNRRLNLNIFLLSTFQFYLLEITRFWWGSKSDNHQTGVIEKTRFDLFDLNLKKLILWNNILNTPDPSRIDRKTERDKGLLGYIPSFKNLSD